MATQRDFPAHLPQSQERKQPLRPSTQESTQEGSFVEAPLYTWRYGQGEDIYVGLHGWNGDHHSFDTLLPYLPLNASLYVIDLPGCGQSPSLHEWTVEAIAASLRQQWEFMGWKQVTVLGNCSGAILGLSTAQRMPKEAIGRFVLIDTFAWIPWYFLLFLIPVFKWIFYYTAFANPLGRWLTNLSLKNKRKENTDLTQGFRQCSPSVNLAYLRILYQMPDYKEFADVHSVTDIVTGQNTFGAVQKGATLWNQVWPTAQRKVLQGAGHLPIQEAPKALADIVFGSSSTL